MSVNTSAVLTNCATALLVSLICLCLSACSTGGGPAASYLSAEAQQQAEAFWQAQLTRCGDSFYRKLELKDGGVEFYEFKEPKVRLAPWRVTDADRLNGIEWHGLIFLEPKVSRVWGTSLGRWEQWANGQGGTSDNSYPMKKTKGQWSINTNRGEIFEETSKYAPVDCAKIPQ